MRNINSDLQIRKDNVQKITSVPNQKTKKSIAERLEKDSMVNRKSQNVVKNKITSSN